MVVQAAIGHQIHLPARHLAVHHARHIHPGLAHQVAAQLNHKRNLRQILFGPLDQLRQVVAHRGQVQPLLAGKVRYAKATAQIQKSHRQRRVLRQPHCQLIRLLLGFTDGLRAQVLRTCVQVKALKRQPGAAHVGQQLGNLLHVHPKLLGAAAHLHARALEFKVRVDAHGHPRGQAQFVGYRFQRANLTERLDIDQHPGGDGLAQLGIAFARPSKTHFLRVGVGVQRHLQLTG